MLVSFQKGNSVSLQSSTNAIFHSFLPEHSGSSNKLSFSPSTQYFHEKIVLIKTSIFVSIVQLPVVLCQSRGLVRFFPSHVYQCHCCGTSHIKLLSHFQEPKSHSKFLIPPVLTVFLPTSETGMKWPSPVGYLKPDTYQ